MIQLFGHLIAKNPPSILLLLGGAGVLLQIAGAGLLLVLGVILQLAWLGFRFGL